MSTEKIKVGIIGPGNIGSDLMYKVMKSRNLQMHMMAGIVESEGIKRAAALGFKTSIEGVAAVVADPEIKFVFDATSAKAHVHNAALLKAAGKIAIDMTPAAVGPYVVPCVNLDALTNEINFNMVTCGGQATVPIAYAINRAADAEYCEIVSCISSKSAGPGTRANIDEFTETTARALQEIGGADRGKAIIILNPADPPLIMTNTIYALVRKPNEKEIVD
jgi:acetaldehyde dehydrogenase